MTPLVVTTRRTRSAVVVVARGRIDLAGERPWREQVEEACGENSTKTLVVVDLTDVGYLSVGTAPLLIRAHYHCLHRGRRLRVAVRPGPVLRTLHLTGVPEIVSICPDLDTALRPLVASRW
ncbi:STAS domain-containing protein [Actinokineospora sp. NPDC004072]